MKYFMIDNLVYGGAERQATYLINNNINVDKVILLENDIKYSLNTKKPIEAIYPKILKIYQRPIKDKQGQKILEQVLKAEDTVVSFLERSNILNIKSSIKTKHKAIISVRNYLSERYKSPKYFYRVSQIKKYYPMADLIVTNSEESKDDLIKNFGVPKEKIKVIYNLIELEKVQELKKKEIKQEHLHLFETPAIINIGSLTPQKAQKQLIEAFSIVKKHYFPEYKLIIIGTGNLKQELLNSIEKLKLTNEVFLIGNVENPFQYLRHSDIFVLNSDFEGFPNVLLESLAVGTPVVAKNCLSGPREMLEIAVDLVDKPTLTKYGYIFPKVYKKDQGYYDREIKYLVESICQMIELKNKKSEDFKKIQRNCRVRSEDFFEKKIIQQWEDILE